MLYLPRDPTPSAVFSRTARVYGAFTDLLVLHGRIIGVIQCNSLCMKVGLLLNAPWCMLLSIRLTKLTMK